MKALIRKVLERFPRVYFFLHYNILWRPDPASVQGILNAYSKKHKRKVFFIQIGANDGLSGTYVFSGDPLHKYIIRDKWSGVFVEPVPYLYEKLKANYGQKRFKFENVAIAEKSGSKPFYYVQDPGDVEDMPWWFNQLNSFFPEKVYGLEKLYPGISKYITAVDIPCLTFSDLLNRHDLKALDMLHIDTEGYDYEIIKTIDFSHVAPKFIYFEHRHLSEEEHKECLAYIESKGYRTMLEQHDTLAIRIKD